MKVILAGYNVDSAVIEELRRNSPPREDITPETLSASYARISRDPRTADKLRAVARAEVDKARRSNQNIIFRMGHHSVAEHAVFNFDIVGISRLAMEEVEKFRLCSFTEKSQRYIKLGDDFVIPEEIKKAGKKKTFEETIRSQNKLYHWLYHKLRSFFFKQNPEMAQQPRKSVILDGWAKEDARYVVSLATMGQLGLTANARSLEHMIRRFSSKPLAEIRELNQKIYQQAKAVAPSIILFTEGSDFDEKTYPELEIQANFLMSPNEEVGKEPVKLVDCTPDADEKLIASSLHASTSRSYKECLQKAKAMNPEEKMGLMRTAFQHMEFYDAVLREFEFVDLTFELIVSASCFAQLKRHRLATLTAQRYDPDLGVILPPSVESVGAVDKFMEIIKKTDQVYSELRKEMDLGAEYILTNAHQRRVLFKTNAREFYHVSRLREDATAQWDIRKLVGEMTEQAKKVMPLTFLLVGGKDAYPQIYASLFGKPPKMVPPK